MSLLKPGQKSIRVVLSEETYQKLKLMCEEHGDLSRLVRALIHKHIREFEKGTEFNIDLQNKRVGEGDIKGGIKDG